MELSNLILGKGYAQAQVHTIHSTSAKVAFSNNVIDKKKGCDNNLSNCIIHIY